MPCNTKISGHWSDLPAELLQKIADCFDTETDVLRFRVVCNHWRSSTTPFKKPPVTSLKLPYPFDGGEPFARLTDFYFGLAESVVYRLQSPDCKEPCSWLVKLGRSADGKMRIYNPLNDRRVVIQPKTPMPKVVNALDYRVSEVCRAYTLHCVNPAKPKLGYGRNFAKKVAVSAGVGSDDCVVMVLDDENKLWYIKSGDENWTPVDEYGFTNRFHDVMFFKGQFYVVGVNGEASVFDSTFKRKKLTWFKYGCASIMRLVELYGDGELYLVEGVTDGDKRLGKCFDINNGWGYRRPITPDFNKVVEIIIYRMDKQKQRWVEIETVNDRIIFAGNDCSLSFSTKEFEGGNGTRVFYPDPYIFFRTKEEKITYFPEISDFELQGGGGGSDDDDDGGDDDYFVCQCCVFSADNKKETFVPGDDVRLKFRELHGHNSGVCDFESGKIGSLLKFPEFPAVFWPPPAWLS